MEQNSSTPAPQPASQPTPRPEPGTPGEQTYSSPLVIGNGITRFFIGLAVVCIILSIALFTIKQLGRPSIDDPAALSGSVYDTIFLILQRINNVAVFARIACLGFAVAATIIRVLNPHPYNTKTLIAAWTSTILTFVALIVFR